MNESRFDFLRPSALLLIAVSLTVLNAACVRSTGVLKDSVFSKSKTSYRIGKIPDGWERVSLTGADIAYVHKQDGSTLLINSSCIKEEDASLLALTFHLLIGMTEQKIIDHKTIPISEREGLETTAEAKLDGVPRKMKLLVYKKDTCIYDIVLSTPPEKFDENLNAYQAILAGFEVPGGSHE